MHVITQKRVREAQARWPEAETALGAWLRIIKGASPKGFAEMKALFPAVDKVGRLHVFDIGGNKIRLIALVRYDRSKVFIKAILDHAEYDRAKWKG